MVNGFNKDFKHWSEGIKYNIAMYEPQARARNKQIQPLFGRNIKAKAKMQNQKAGKAQEPNAKDDIEYPFEFGPNAKPSRQ